MTKGKIVAGWVCLCVCLGVGAAGAEKKPGAAVAPYADVRGLDLRGQDLDLALIRTLWFNEKTVWDADDGLLARRVMAQGKNPGLGVRSLHERGITGKGVNVAIIDQNMCLDHPEFAGKIVKYRDMGCDTPANEGSMHGPAVTSLLVGQTIGTAPGTRVYYAAAPSWKQDAQYYADALDWIIAENRLLGSDHKIRVVSVSAAPSGASSPFTRNKAAWDRAVARAHAAGLLVLDCTDLNGWVETGYYDVTDPEDVSAASTGFPRSGPNFNCSEQSVSAPNSFRSQAEEYRRGDCSYQYMGQGGLSWSVPYVAGVLAMGWQVQPRLSNEQILTLLRGSTFSKNGCGIIDPLKFIDGVSDWPIEPPDGFSLARLENNLIFFREFVNRLTWQRKSGGTAAVVNYRLYRRAQGAGEDSWQLLIELTGDVFAYDDRGLSDGQHFAYAIRSVSVHGVESDPVIVEN
jgi:serine protease AprX